MDIATYLDTQLRAAGIPIIGVSVASLTDRSKWSVLYAPGASDAQQAQANTLLQTITIDPATLQLADDEVRFDGDKIVKALVVWCAQRFGITVAQARTQLLTIYRGLP
jgi:hypothetical protein